MNANELEVEEASPEINIERLFLINESKSGESGSKAAEHHDNSHTLIRMDSEQTDIRRFSSASLTGGAAVVADALKVEEIRVRESPVVGNVTDALARGVWKDPVVGDMTDALMRIGGAGDQQVCSYQEIPSDKNRANNDPQTMVRGVIALQAGPDYGFCRPTAKICAAACKGRRNTKSTSY